MTEILSFKENNILIANLTSAVRLNTYLGSAGTLQKKAYDKLKIELNNDLVRKG